MAFKFNGNTPKKIFYNTKKVSKLIYNNVLVWTANVLKRIVGTPPLTLKNCVDEPINQKINGNVEQEEEPTPDNPVDVKTLKGENRLNFDGNLMVGSDGKFITGGNYRSGFVKLSKDETCYLSGDTTKLNAGVFRIGFSEEIPAPGVLYERIRNIDTGGIYKATKNGYLCIMLSFYNSTTEEEKENIISTIMLNEGTEPKDYVPYGYIKETIRGKNLFDDSIVSNLWSNYQTGQILANTGSNLKKYDCESGEKISVSATFDVDDNNNAILIQFFDKTGNNLGRYAISQKNNQSLTKIAPENTSYFYAGRYKNKPTSIQVEIGEATDYEPYQEPKEQLIYIGDNELLTDDFVEVDEKGNTKIAKKYTKITLNGSENWFFNIAQNGKKRPATGQYSSIIQENISNDSLVGAYSTHFKEKTPSSTYSLQQGFSVNLGAELLFFDERFQNSTDINEWKRELQQNPITVYLPLAEPTETDLGQHEPIIPLEGTNNISIDTEIQPSKMEIEYYAKED